MPLQNKDFLQLETIQAKLTLVADSLSLWWRFIYRVTSPNQLITETCFIIISKCAPMPQQNASIKRAKRLYKFGREKLPSLYFRSKI